jgi:hypothetical protein
MLRDGRDFSSARRPSVGRGSAALAGAQASCSPRFTVIVAARIIDSTIQLIGALLQQRVRAVACTGPYGDHRALACRRREAPRAAPKQHRPRPRSATATPASARLDEDRDDCWEPARPPALSARRHALDDRSARVPRPLLLRLARCASISRPMSRADRSAARRAARAARARVALARTRTVRRSRSMDRSARRASRPRHGARRRARRALVSRPPRPPGSRRPMVVHARRLGPRARP